MKKRKTLKAVLRDESTISENADVSDLVDSWSLMIADQCLTAE